MCCYSNIRKLISHKFPQLMKGEAMFNVANVANVINVVNVLCNPNWSNCINHLNP